MSNSLALRPVSNASIHDRGNRTRKAGTMIQSAHESELIQYARSSRARALRYRRMNEPAWEKEAWESAFYWLAMARVERKNWTGWNASRRVA